jgi:hypothetical protein
MEGDKKMSREIFKEVGSLPIVGIYDINYAYDSNMGLHTTSSLDILKLSAIANKGVKS